jgi:hypothetical protein
MYNNRQSLLNIGLIADLKKAMNPDIFIVKL